MKTQTPTKQQIKEMIPEHCFERSNLKSFGYLFRDTISICVMYYLSTFIQYAPNFTQPFLWFIWCFFQGVFFTAVWMIGHECGHQAFSASSWINDSVGMVTHSFVLVPFFAWKFSHVLIMQILQILKKMNHGFLMKRRTFQTLFFSDFIEIFLPLLDI
jgi:fatty acid desaturase